jgi:amino acid transporter
MSINAFIDFMEKYALGAFIALAAIPLMTLVWGLLHKKERSGQAPWKYGYSLFTYLACITGMFAAILVCYALFFTHQSLLNMNALAYFLPLVTMAVTLLIIRGRVSFKELPGFGRLSGLMIMIAVSFALALIIDRTRIFMSFFGTIDHLFILVGAIFVLLKVGFWLSFGRKKTER